MLDMLYKYAPKVVTRLLTVLIQVLVHASFKLTQNTTSSIKSAALLDVSAHPAFSKLFLTGN